MMPGRTYNAIDVWVDKFLVQQHDARDYTDIPSAVTLQ